jgi:YHS domain-containing protein
MFGFKKHCKICGLELKKEQATKRFGKFFCSEKHATEFMEIVKSQMKEEGTRRRGGCC